MLSASPALLRELASYCHLASAPPPPPMYAPPDGALKLIHEAEAVESARAADGESDDDGGVSSMGALYERAATDGELLDSGAASLLAAIQPTESAVFADLGSGKGGAVFRVAASAEMAQCIGLELMGTKHKAALRTLEAVRPQLRTPTTLLQGDMLELASWATSTDNDARFADLTHAFSCSVCFDDFLLRRIAAALGDARVFPRLQSFVSLRELPSQPHLVRIGSVALDCSWRDGVPGHVYVPSDLVSRPEEAWKDSIPMLSRFLCRGCTCALPTALQWADGTYVRLPK